MKNMLKKIVRVFATALSIGMFVLMAGAALTLLTGRTEIMGIRSYVVQTGSMQPTLPVGSLIFSQREAEYGKGDIITFFEGDKSITHRIVGVKDGDFITQGDANNVADSESVSKEQVVGKTMFHIPYVGVLTHQLRTPQGFLLFFVLPGLVFIAMELWSIKNEIVKSTERRVREQWSNGNDFSNFKTQA